MSQPIPPLDQTDLIDLARQALRLAEDAVASADLRAKLALASVHDGREMALVDVLVAKDACIAARLVRDTAKGLLEQTYSRVMEASTCLQ